MVKSSENRTFSNKVFRKEINLLARKSSKKKVLDLYATAIKKEKAKLAAKEKKMKAVIMESDEESDSDASICVIEPVKEKTDKKRKETTKEDNLVELQRQRLGKAMAVFEKHRKKSKKNTEEASLEEEQEYKRKVKWLKDHGESDVEETSSETSTNEK